MTAASWVQREPSEMGGEKRIRLAFVTERISWKAWNILPYLSECFDITLITCSSPDEIPKAEYRKIIRIPLSKHEMLPTTAWTISRCVDGLCKAREVEFAYVYSSIAYLISACPFVNVVNGSFFEDFRIWLSHVPYPKKLKALTGFLHYVIPEFVACKRADKIIAVSQSLGEMVQAYYGRESHDVQAVLNGLGSDYLDLYGESKFEAASIGLIYTGRLHVRKGIVDLVKEFRKRPHIQVPFYVVGEGPERAELQRLAEVDGRVVLTGHVDRYALARHLRETSIYLFPSLHEGFGLSLVEAMASGHACIVYDMPVNREVLGEAGIFVPYNRPSMMWDMVEKCIEKKDWLRQKAREAHEKAQNYSWERCAREMEAAIRRAYAETVREREYSQ